MPRYIPVGEYELSLTHSQEGVSEQAVCTMGLRYEGDNFAGDHPFAALAWATKMMSGLNQVITLTSARFSTNEGTVTELPLNTPGSNIGDCAPYQVAYLVHKNNVTVGKRGNGRMFLPGVNEEFINSAGVLTTAHHTDLQTHLDDLYEALVTANFQPVLFHSPRTGDLTPFSSFVTGFGADARVATQRGRLRR